MTEDKIQLYTEVRKQWNVQNYNGNTYLSISDISADNMFSKDEQDELKEGYLDNIFETSGIYDDTFVNALFIYDNTNKVISSIFECINEWVDAHNLQLEVHNVQWTGKEVSHVLINMGEECIIQNPVVDGVSLSYLSRILKISTSKGTEYEVRQQETRIDKENVLKSRKNIDTDGVKHNATEKKVSKIRETSNVYYAKTPLEPRVKVNSKKDNIKLEDINQTSDKQKTLITSKPKISNDELNNIIKEATKEFNHTVREPR